MSLNHGTIPIGWSSSLQLMKILLMSSSNYFSHTIGKYSVVVWSYSWSGSSRYHYKELTNGGDGISPSSCPRLPQQQQQQPPLLDDVGVVRKHPTDGGSSGDRDGAANDPTRSTTSISAKPPLSSSSMGDTDEGLQQQNETTTSKTESGIDWVAFLVELTLSIGIAVITSMILTFITRKFFKGVLSQQQQSPSADQDDTGKSETQVYRRLKQILIKRNKYNNNNDPTNVVVVPTLTMRELQMADEIIDPDDIECTFADIGGLDTMKQEIYELAIVPLLRPQLFPSNSKLLQPAKGVLLYGKPGTGKTMLAKALAKESCAIFLPLQLSKILNKYWGESNKVIAATFSLAHKLQPAVIFIDELDTFLKNSNSETAYMDSIKAEFLTLWDGVATSAQSRVLILGATNKPQHIDSAILRRMPRAFEVPLPDDTGRLAILQLLFKDENIDDTILPALPTLVEATKGYSGSDLKELCKAAAMVAVQEHTSEFARRRVMGEPDSALDEALDQPIRPMTETDLIAGLEKVRRTGEAAYKYGKQSAYDQRQQQQQQQAGSTHHPANASMDAKSLQHFVQLLRVLSDNVQLPNDDSNGDIPNL